MAIRKVDDYMIWCAQWPRRVWITTGREIYVRDRCDGLDDCFYLKEKKTIIDVYRLLIFLVSMFAFCLIHFI